MPETVASFKFVYQRAVPTYKAEQPLHFCSLLQKLKLLQVLHLVILACIKVTITHLLISICTVS